jgi:hypothetical protein
MTNNYNSNRTPNTQDALEKEAYDWDCALYEWYNELQASDEYDARDALNKSVDQYNEFARYVFFGQVPLPVNEDADFPF